MLQRIAQLLKIQPVTEPTPGLLFANGATVPTDGDAGYMTGCLFQHTDGGNGTALYVNEGTVAACGFKAVTVAD